jgi:hypothetical protein
MRGGSPAPAGGDGGVKPATSAAAARRSSSLMPFIMSFITGTLRVPLRKATS